MNCYLVHTSSSWGNPTAATASPNTQRTRKGVCSHDVFLRTLGGTAVNPSTPAVVPAAQAGNDANQGNCTFKEIIEHTTTVTSQRQRVSARYGQNLATRKERTPTGGNNTPEEATVTETERQHAQIRDITPEKAIVTETERFRALVQVMLHY